MAPDFFSACSREFHTASCSRRSGGDKPRGIDDRVAEKGLAASPRRAAGKRPGQALSDRLPVAWAFPLIVFAVTWLLILAAWYGSAVIYRQGHPWTWHFLFKDAGYSWASPSAATR